MHPQPRSEVREAFELYASKAPVNQPGPQAIATRAARRFWHLLAPGERMWLQTERSHNLGTYEDPRRKIEDRRGFDFEVARVRERLFGAGARAPRKHCRPRKERGRKRGT